MELDSNLIVRIPSVCQNEVRYAFHCLLKEFLGLEYSVELNETNTNYEIQLGGKNIIIQNTFFNKDIDILNFEAIPKTVKDGKLKIGNSELPILSLYGNSRLNIENNSYILESDIIASTFFMLSRWEEKVNKDRDNHNRFPASSSVAYKHGFIDRAIVNEYVEILWHLLLQLGIKQKRKERKYELAPTHDVDVPYLLYPFSKVVLSLLSKTKRGRFKEVIRMISCFVRNNDPWDTYDLFMDMSEKRNTKSHFFFLQKGKAKQDENHEIDTPKIKDLIKHIKNRGHLVGFHPSYNAYNNPSLFQKEKNYLETVMGQEVSTGRNHFLRWDVSQSPKIWEDNDMKWDSTLGYADHAGFRCGVCYPFPLYDLENNKQLDVYERPLIVMEWSLVNYQGLEISEAEDYIQKLKSQVKKYNGEFVFLYHNSAFFTDHYQYISDRLLNSLYT